MESMGIIKSSKKFWKNRRVLVTGGAGFIGTWLTHDLIKLEARVVVLDIKEKIRPLGKSSHALLKKVTFIQGDILDISLLKKLFQKYQFEIVFHLAAQSLVGEALEDPSLTLDTNVKGTWHILETARRQTKKPKVIIASSDKAYGTHDNLPYRENYPLFGENPYDCSKSCADLIANMYAKTYHLAVCITRCGNVYGGGDINFSRLIPDAIRALFLNKTFEIRSDGSYKRDYVYVKDISEAYLRTAEEMEKQHFVGEVFNFGTNHPLRVLEVVDCIAKMMGKRDHRNIIRAAAKYEIKDQYLDATKAVRLLQWNPRYEFSRGIKETIEWYRNYFEENEKAKR